MHSTDSSAAAHSEPAPICPVHPWCDVPHLAYGHSPHHPEAEHRSTTYTAHLPGAGELLAFGIDQGFDERPTAWIGGSDSMNLDAVRLADAVTTLRRALTDMVRLQAQLAVSEQQWRRQQATRQHAPSE